jgi:hypothetical protein
MLNPETVQNNQTDLQQSQSFGDQLSDNVDTFSNKDQNPSYVESVDNAEVPFQQYQTYQGHLNLPIRPLEFLPLNPLSDPDLQSDLQRNLET